MRNTKNLHVVRKFRAFCLFCLLISNFPALGQERKWDARAIPFEINTTRIWIKAIINQKVEANFIVDNGCSEVILSDKFVKKHAETLGMQILPTTPFLGRFLQFNGGHCCIAKSDLTFHFGDITIEHTCNSAYTLENGEKILKFVGVANEIISNQILLDADGILPLKLFEKMGIIKIDSRVKEISFVGQIDSLATRYPYTSINNLQIIKLPLHFKDKNKQPYSYSFSTLLDLGFTGDLMLLENTRTKPLRNHVKEMRATGNQAYLFENVYLGKNPAKPSTYTLSLGITNPSLDLVVGMGILSKNELFFDYPSKIIALKAIDSLPNHPTSFIVQVRILKNGYQYKVTSVYQEVSWLDLHVGDELLRVGDIDLEKVSPNRFKSILYNYELNAKISVKRQGKVLILDRNDSKYQRHIEP